MSYSYDFPILCTAEPYQIQLAIGDEIRCSRCVCGVEEVRIGDEIRSCTDICTDIDNNSNGIPFPPPPPSPLSPLPSPPFPLSFPPTPLYPNSKPHGHKHSHDTVVYCIGAFIIALSSGLLICISICLCEWKSHHLFLQN